MKIIRSFVVFILVTGMIFPLTAQNLSNKGSVFWAGYGHHQYMEPGQLNSQEMVLYFSADQAATVTVTIKGTTYKEVYAVPANSVVASNPIPKGLSGSHPSTIDARLFTLPPSFPGGTGSEGIFANKGIKIESDVPIVAYAHIFGNQSSGATMLMPVETWGYSFTALNTRQYYGGSDFNCFSWVYIVSKQNNTRIRIKPSVNTRSGKPANIPFEVTLQEGDIYQLVGDQIDDKSSLDLTGTIIQSVENDAAECYPVAVFSGNSRTSLSCVGAPGGTGDNIFQQMFPYQAWGKRYLTTPTSADQSVKTRNMNVYRILVKDPATIVKKNGIVLFGLNGFYYEYQSNTADYIEADKPVMMAQYMPSSGACGYIGMGDPEMIFISSMEQAIKQAGFYRNDKENIKYNYLSLTIPNGGLSSLTIDGGQAFSDVYPHDNLPGYSVVVKRWGATPAQCQVKSDSPFTAITYGIGAVESYGYNAGTLINNLNGLPAIKNEYNRADTFNTYTCANTPVRLSVLTRYQPTRISWKLSHLAAVMQPSTDMVQDNPVAEGQVVVKGVTYYKYSLPATYLFSSAGDFDIPVFTTHPTVEACNFTEQIPYTIRVKDALKTGFTINYENCKASENILFQGQDAFTDNSAVRQWEWNFTGNSHTSSATGKEIGEVFTAGDYRARLLAVDNNGCVADTSLPFRLADKPAPPEFTLKSASSCAGESQLFSEINPEQGIKSWYWDFGNGDEQTLSANGQELTRLFPQYQKLTVKHLVKFSETCMSDTVKKEFMIYARPVPRIEFTDNCLPKDGLVKFSNLSTVPDGQAIVKYNWEFGDPAANASNPNISSEKEPGHIFSNGTYSIRHSLVSEKGCVKDTTIQTRFSLRALLAYADPVQAPVCADASLRVSVAVANITNAVDGMGVYKGPGVRSDGIFIPAPQYTGLNTIQYVYTSTGGCIDSVASHIEVLPIPEISAGPDLFVAQGSLSTLQASANPESGMNFHWSPAALLNNANTLKPAYLATQDQLFTVTVTDISGTCSATDSVWVKIFRPVKVPNVFSPNGDGIHDRWEILNLGDYKDCIVEVYNRYGRLVLHAKGYANPWDGRFNGSPLPVGTYYYLINLKNGMGRLTGSITILR